MSVHSLKFVVIGGPGNGKSSVLNEFAQDDLFAEGASGAPCTQIGPDNVKKIMIEDGDDKFDITLVDTPGFPCPDAKKAAEYYDHVIEECNKKINGVLFVLKQDVPSFTLLEQYETLLRPFANLKPPLILLVNGLENPTARQRCAPDFAEKKCRTMDQMRSLGQIVLERSGLLAHEVLVSFCRDELHALGMRVLHVFATFSPQESQVMTFTQLRDEFARCNSQAIGVETQLTQQVNLWDAKCAEDIAELEVDAQYLEDVASNLLSKAAAQRARISELRAHITQATMTSTEAQLREKRVQELNQMVNRMTKTLVGEL